MKLRRTTIRMTWVMRRKGRLISFWAYAGEIRFRRFTPQGAA